MRRDLKNRNILVVGGAGFIGSHLVDALTATGANAVYVMDNMFLGRESNLAQAMQKGVALYKDDAEIKTSVQAIVRRHKIDVVFNLATKALNYSFFNPQNAFMTNVAVLSNLLELQRDHEFESLCHYSSSEIYGSAVYDPMDEKHPMNPTTTYAAGKAAADLLLQTYVAMFDLDAFIIRPFNNYGPRQNWEGDLAGIIPATARRILGGEKPVLCGTGEQKRDYIYVKDTVKATLALYPLLEKGETVNVSADMSLSVTELLATLCQLMGYQGEYERLPARKADVQYHHASNAYMRSLIDFQPVPLPEGLKETLDWYQEVMRP